MFLFSSLKTNKQKTNSSSCPGCSDLVDCDPQQKAMQREAKSSKSESNTALWCIIYLQHSFELVMLFIGSDLQKQAFLLFPRPRTTSSMTFCYPWLASTAFHYPDSQTFMSPEHLTDPNTPFYRHSIQLFHFYYYSTSILTSHDFTVFFHVTTHLHALSILLLTIMF